jgi:hypothetical protein
MNMRNIRKMIARNIRNVHVDDVLDMFGLERRRSTNWLAVLGIFAAGAAVGSTVALMLAPASGNETRERISKRVHDAIEARRNGRTAASTIE